MAGKRVLLTLNPAIHEELQQKAEANLMTIQEYISDILRRSVLAGKPRKRGKVGRPPKVEDPFIERFTRKR